jgi:hypothetical protein
LVAGAQNPADRERSCRKRDAAGTSGYLKTVTAKYPLLPLSTLRDAATEQRSRELGVAEATRVSKEQEFSRAVETLKAAQAELENADLLARQRLESGLARAIDLGRAADERRARLASLAELTGRAEKLARERDRAAEKCDEARRALAQAEAEERAVERHRAAWLRKEELARAELADEEATERWTSERAARSGPH